MAFVSMAIAFLVMTGLRAAVFTREEILQAQPHTRTRRRQSPGFITDSGLLVHGIEACPPFLDGRLFDDM